MGALNWNNGAILLRAHIFAAATAANERSNENLSPDEMSRFHIKRQQASDIGVVISTNNVNKGAQVDIQKSMDARGAVIIAERHNTTLYPFLKHLCSASFYG